MALSCAAAEQDFYLGNPLAKTVKLTLPDGAFSVTLDQARADHQLLGGWHAVQRTRRIKRAYGLSFSALGADSADQIISILYGLLGPGPYFFLDPGWRNVLASHIAGAGGGTQTSNGFVAAGGAVAYSSTITPPTAAPLSGVQAWTGAGNGSELWLGASAAQILERSAIPSWTFLPQTFSFWAKTASSAANIAIDAYFNTAPPGPASNGTYVSSVQLATGVALSTGWTRYSATLAAASIPATAYCNGFAIRCLTAGAPAIHLAALGAQFVTASAAGTGTSALPAWVLGLPVPRMLLSSTAPANATSLWWRRNYALTLVEAA